MSLLPTQDENENYGFFGYRGAMCDRAIRTDNPKMLAECIEKGFVDATSEVLGAGTVLDYCRKIAPKCAAMLETL